MSAAPVSAARLDRELRRVIAGPREHHAVAVGRFLSGTLLVTALAAFLPWTTVACAAGIIRNLVGF
ncbi:hypothetical protein J2Y69_001389 [Microbacterium resistens]|uniref:DUF2892 domain-containing protein n=1 Tax=Microbacterium resistens TaxID=156977 RepID=A0ABU1SB37_9MICO|nr:hypothetical protein [Microbacterium resistens]